MLKKIRSEQVRLGMYLHAFCGAWLDHPFWRSSFVLKDPQDIASIHASKIREVWIDTDKGLDVLQDAVAVEASAPPPPEAQPSTPPPPLPAISREPTSFNEELKQAARICAKSKQAVVSMFQEARLGKAVDAAEARELVEEISGSVMRNPEALISLARLKTADEYTYMHSVAVCALMIALGKQLGLGEFELREAGVAGLLHDLGKAVIPLEILNKPGKLTDEEFDIIKTHPAEGHRMLQDGSGVGDIALEVCLHHHEKTDGSGYPHRLNDSQITLFAKMGAVCDVYDAITSNRPYKRGWDPAESLKKMAEWAKGHFDPTIFQAFVKSVGIYPIGSFVRLESGRMGVVVGQSEQSLLMPLVKVFFSAKSRARIMPEVLDLSRAGNKDRIVSREDPAAWGIANIDEMWSGRS
ncbi:MAG: hypothetical protein RIR00_245 [Pseudomonadota bacterium]|jgi:HD-GYP domain-containing protein (c-di-GMP phosphodiesterase class II)